MIRGGSLVVPVAIALLLRVVERPAQVRPAAESPVVPLALALPLAAPAAPIQVAALIAPDPPARAMRVEVPDASEPVEIRGPRVHDELTFYESRFDAARGGRVRGPDGVEVAVQPGSLVDRDGRRVEGEVAVRWALLDHVDKLAAAPGELATAVAGEPVPLQSFGMVKLSFHVDRAEVELAKLADRSFPVADGAGDGDPVRMYRFDPGTGLWVEQGPGAVEGTRFTLQIDRSGWWNCDRPLMARGCVRGTIAHDGWDLPDDTRAHLVGIEYMTRDVATPAEDGSFCLDGMPGVAARIEAFQLGAQCFSLQSALVTASEAGTSCFRDASACATVTIEPTPIACGQARAALDAIGNTRQVAAAATSGAELTWIDVLEPTTLRVPDDIAEARLRCGAKVQTAKAEAGVVTFPEVPIHGGCKVRLTEQSGAAWILDHAAGGREYTCARRGRSVRCDEWTVQ